MRLVLLLFVACTGHTTTIVRMARRGEFVHPERRFGCEGSGRPELVVLDPVVEFARTYLIQKLDGCARWRDARVHWTVAGLKDPPLRSGIQVLVEPRAKVGTMQISIKRGSWDAGSFYCLHVREEYGMRTVVVEWAGGWLK